MWNHKHFNCQQLLPNVFLLLILSRFSGHSDLNVMDTKGNLTYTGAAHSGTVKKLFLKFTNFHYKTPDFDSFRM